MTPCTGRHDLFDSTELEDHRTAARLCATCPALAECTRLLTEARELATAPNGLPEGTWAGQLIGVVRPEPRRRPVSASRIRVAEEDATWTEEEARKAHNAHTQGDRSEWARIGERTYQRRIHRARRARARRTAA